MTHICTSFVPRTIRIWSILPVDIACAPSTETFKSRLIEAIRTGAIVVAPPRTVTTIHAGVGARGQPLEAFWDGRPWEGIKKKLKKLNKIVHRLFLAVAITLHNFTHILLHCIHIFIFYYALILSGFLHYNILTTFHIHVYLFMYDFYYLISYF